MFVGWINLIRRVRQHHASCCHDNKENEPDLKHWFLRMQEERLVVVHRWAFFVDQLQGPEDQETIERLRVEFAKEALLGQKKNKIEAALAILYF